MEAEGLWLPITDYSEYREISISTIRRYIKANRVQYKMQKGKYFIFVKENNYQKKQRQKECELLELRLNSKDLEAKVKILEEENNDLKMLIKLYEGKLPSLSKIYDSPSESPRS